MDTDILSYKFVNELNRTISDAAQEGVPLYVIQYALKDGLNHVIAALNQKIDASNQTVTPNAELKESEE